MKLVFESNAFLFPHSILRSFKMSHLNVNINIP